SPSSSGFGNSTSGTRRRRALADFLAHRVLAGLEGVQEALGLLLEELSALVEPLAGAPLRLGRELLRLLRHVAAPLGEELARLLAGLGRQQKGRRGAERRAEEEPAQVSRRVASVVTHGHLLDSFAGAGRPPPRNQGRSEEHTSELQSRRDLVCRLLLEKKKNKTYPE